MELVFQEHGTREQGRGTHVHKQVEFFPLGLTLEPGEKLLDL